MNKVTISADPSGQVVVVGKNNPEYGYIRVSQTRMVVDDRGWARAKPTSALILGTTSELRSFGYKNGQELEGRVVVREMLTPFNKKNPEKDLKIAGDTKIICVIGDQPIYRKTFFSVNPDAQDTLLEHTNKEQIKAAFDASKVAVVTDKL